MNLSFRRLGAEIAHRSHQKSAFSPQPVAVWALVALAAAPRPAVAETPRYETVVEAPAPLDSEPRRDRTASASVITTQRTPRSGESLAGLLAELPGVTVTRFGSQGSLATLSLRGSSPNQVAVYADGVPLASALVGSVDLGLLPLTAAQRIEVYRGTSPLGFGASAMGGVVALTSEAPAESGLSAYSGFGSFGTWSGGGSAAWVGTGADLVARLAGFSSRADFPYHSDNRTLFDPSDDRALRRQNNQLGQLDGAVRGSLRLPGNRRLILATSALTRRQGLPARGTDASFRTKLHRRRALGSLSYLGPTDLGPGGALEASLYGLLATQRLDDPLAEVAFVPADTHDRSTTFGARAVASRRLWPWLKTSVMLDGRHERFVPEDRLRPEQRPPGSRLFGASGLEASATGPRGLLVVANLRVEMARDVVSGTNAYGPMAGESAPASYVLPVARLGLLQTLSGGVDLRANLGRYSRLPSLFERYGNGGLVRGNPALEPETGSTADVGLGWRWTGAAFAVHLDAALFANRARDLIHFEEQGYFASYVNVARSRTLGAELSVNLRLYENLFFVGQATVQDSRDRTPIPSRLDHHLPHQPRVRGYLRPEIRGLTLFGAIAGGLYADAEVVGGFYQDGANLVRNPGRLLFGAGAYLESRRLGLRLLASAYNLGDVRAVDVLEYPVPGRSFFLTLHFTLSTDRSRDPHSTPKEIPPHDL